MLPAKKALSLASGVHGKLAHRHQRYNEMHGDAVGGGRPRAESIYSQNYGGQHNRALAGNVNSKHEVLSHAAASVYGGYFVKHNNQLQVKQ